MGCSRCAANLSHNLLTREKSQLQDPRQWHDQHHKFVCWIDHLLLSTLMSEWTRWAREVGGRKSPGKTCGESENSSISAVYSVINLPQCQSLAAQFVAQSQHRFPTGKQSRIRWTIETMQGNVFYDIFYQLYTLILYVIPNCAELLWGNLLWRKETKSVGSIDFSWLQLDTESWAGEKWPVGRNCWVNHSPKWVNILTTFSFSSAPETNVGWGHECAETKNVLRIKFSFYCTVRDCFEQNELKTLEWFLRRGQFWFVSGCSWALSDWLVWCHFTAFRRNETVKAKNAERLGCIWDKSFLKQNWNLKFWSVNLEFQVSYSFIYPLFDIRFFCGTANHQ